MHECPNCIKLQKRVEALTARVNDLEAQLRRSKKQATPFSRGQRKKKPKKPGRKKGKGTFARREAPPEEGIEEVAVALTCCPDCSGPLQNKQTHAHIQSDIPRPDPQHTRFINESGYCPRCKKHFRSRHPEQGSTAGGAAGTSVGPNAKAVAVDMHHRFGVPYAKIADHLQTVSGLTVTASGLCQASERLAKKAEPVYQELIAMIREAATVHADETGWRIGVLSAWLWVFSNKTITVYTIKASRAHEVVVDILGKSFKGVLHADCFRAYDHQALKDWIQQKCFSHLLKDLDKMCEQKTRGSIRFPREVAELLRKAIQLKKDKDDISALAYSRRRNAIERKLDGLIDEKRNFADPDNKRFAGRLRKQRRHLFTFLDIGQAEATNNQAERDIRPSVPIRKTGGCNKTEKGANAHAINSSILATAKKQGRNTVNVIKDILTAPIKLVSLSPKPP